MDSNSLSHTKWSCKYHIVFAPKYRRKEIGRILGQLCEWKNVEIIEAHAFVNHIHMLVARLHLK